MELVKALRITRQSQVAFVGSGGKSTTIFQLARQLSPPVIVTATTHLAVDQLGLADRHYVVNSSENFDDIEWREEVILFTGELSNDGRTQGIEKIIWRKFVNWRSVGIVQF
ncbi:MAG: hypothetical protein HC806_10180 [Anaerolineae bacterium]|nr:hypothetical protein [Anaerolineae bacterium]